MDKAYKQLKLSNEKKREFVNLLKEQGSSSKNRVLRKPQSFTWVAMPLFVIVAITFAALSMHENVSQTTGAIINVSDTTHEQFLKEMLVLWVASLVLLTIAYVELLLLARKPSQLVRHSFIRFAHNSLGTWKAAVVFLAPFVLLIAESILVFVYFSYIELQTFFVILHLLFVIMFMQLFLVKNRKAATCPHCGEVLSKKSIYFNYVCQSCGKGRYLKVENRSKKFFATSGWLILLLFPLFNIFTFWHGLFFGIIYLWFTLTFVIPYLDEFTKDDELPPPLW